MKTLKKTLKTFCTCINDRIRNKDDSDIDIVVEVHCSLV